MYPRSFTFLIISIVMACFYSSMRESKVKNATMKLQKVEKLHQEQKIILSSLNEWKFNSFCKTFLKQKMYLFKKARLKYTKVVCLTASLSNFLWRHILREKAGNIICHPNIIHSVQSSWCVFNVDKSVYFFTHFSSMKYQK